MAYTQFETQVTAGQVLSAPQQVQGTLRAVAIDGTGNTGVVFTVQLLTPFGWADVRSYRQVMAPSVVNPPRRMLFAAQQMPIGFATYRLRASVSHTSDMPLTWFSQQYEGSV